MQPPWRGWFFGEPTRRGRPLGGGKPEPFGVAIEQVYGLGLRAPDQSGSCFAFRRHVDSFRLCPVRRLLAATGTDHGDIDAALMGEKASEGWGFLKARENPCKPPLDSSPPNTVLIAGRPWPRRAGPLNRCGLVHSIGGTVARSLIDHPAREMPGHPGRGARRGAATGPGCILQC